MPKGLSRERCKWPDALSGWRVVMTETLVGMDAQVPGPDPGDAELSAARELVRQAQAAGLSLTGPGGLDDAHRNSPVSLSEIGLLVTGRA
jgi:hypothetical protein